ncbi:sigma 54-interacting transcriptional regulator [Halomonas sp. E19]|uniref:sigma 54-interacting transcriptional regulator n=1 Tax=Halomonas sp. E19 TaxID=3397247 RepID=UPI0040338F87
MRGESNTAASGPTASHDQPAKPLAQAAGGTLFLDEVSELSAQAQHDLLHLIERGALPDPETGRLVPFDVRVIASTHADLEVAMEAGHFRPDLYHRLRVLEVEVPPLRERQEDIEPLAHAIFRDYAQEKSPCVRGFSQEALVLMKRYAWPGNLRELVNRVRRAMVMCEQRLIKPADLGLERRSSNRHIITLEEARNVAEREVLLNALNRSQYKIKKAADELGVSRVTLYRLMEKHALDRRGEPEPGASP